MPLLFIVFTQDLRSLLILHFSSAVLLVPTTQFCTRLTSTPAFSTTRHLPFLNSWRWLQLHSAPSALIFTWMANHMYKCLQPSLRHCQCHCCTSVARSWPQFCYVNSLIPCVSPRMYNSRDCKQSLSPQSLRINICRFSFPLSFLSLSLSVCVCVCEWKAK